VAFLHTNALHVGTRCQIRLVDKHAQDQHVTGIIARSRHVRNEVYEIGIHFDETIEPRFFVDPTACPAE
jgi:hypothetical protein